MPNFIKKNIVLLIVLVLVACSITKSKNNITPKIKNDLITKFDLNEKHFETKFFNDIRNDNEFFKKDEKIILKNLGIQPNAYNIQKLKKIISFYKDQEDINIIPNYKDLTREKLISYIKKIDKKNQMLNLLKIMEKNYGIDVQSKSYVEDIKEKITCRYEAESFCNYFKYTPLYVVLISTQDKLISQEIITEAMKNYLFWKNINIMKHILDEYKLIYKKIVDKDPSLVRYFRNSDVIFLNLISNFFKKKSKIDLYSNLGKTIERYKKFFYKVQYKSKQKEIINLARNAPKFYTREILQPIKNSHGGVCHGLSALVGYNKILNKLHTTNTNFRLLLHNINNLVVNYLFIERTLNNKYIKDPNIEILITKILQLQCGGAIFDKIFCFDYRQSDFEIAFGQDIYGNYLKQIDKFPKSNQSLKHTNEILNQLFFYETLFASHYILQKQDFDLWYVKYDYNCGDYEDQKQIKNLEGLIKSLSKISSELKNYKHVLNKIHSPLYNKLENLELFIHMWDFSKVEKKRPIIWDDKKILHQIRNYKKKKEINTNKQKIKNKIYKLDLSDSEKTILENNYDKLQGTFCSTYLNFYKQYLENLAKIELYYLGEIKLDNQTKTKLKTQNFEITQNLSFEQKILLNILQAKYLKTKNLKLAMSLFRSMKQYCKYLSELKYCDKESKDLYSPYYIKPEYRFKNIMHKYYPDLISYKSLNDFDKEQIQIKKIVDLLEFSIDCYYDEAIVTMYNNIETYLKEINKGEEFIINPQLRLKYQELKQILNYFYNKSQNSKIFKLEFYKLIKVHANGIQSILKQYNEQNKLLKIIEFLEKKKNISISTKKQIAPLNIFLDYVNFLLEQKNANFYLDLNHYQKTFFEPNQKVSSSFLQFIKSKKLDFYNPNKEILVSISKNQYSVKTFFLNAKDESQQMLVLNKLQNEEIMNYLNKVNANTMNLIEFSITEYSVYHGHAILLYKQDQDKFLLYDPNRTTDINILTSTINLKSILTPSYFNKKTKESKIAVKITSFELAK